MAAISAAENSTMYFADGNFQNVSPNVEEASGVVRSVFLTRKNQIKRDAAPGLGWSLIA